MYCGKQDTPLQMEHLIPKSRGGTDRISNLTLSCEFCNQKKGTQTAEEFGFPEIQAQAKIPLKDAAMMNATRWKLADSLKGTLKETLKETALPLLPLELGSGGLTKFNRTQRGLPKLPKTHGFDAVCVGKSTPERISIQTDYLNIWKCLGRGSRQMCQIDKFGFPKAHRGNKKFYFGFQTGDLVVAKIPKGKYQGTWKGMVSIRKSGYFDVRDNTGKRTCQGVSHKYLTVIQRNSGWSLESVAISKDSL